MDGAIRAAAVACVCCLVFGCTERDLGILHPQVSRAIDDRVRSDGVADVDLLLVIDDSHSMVDEQRILREQIPLLVRGLTEPPDEDGDGEPDWNPVESLQVGVVTTDLGTSGYETREFARCGLAGSLNDPFGDDGRLRDDAACGTDGPVQVWQSGDDPDAFVDRVGCLAEAGSEGCGFEQPLGAAIKALQSHSHLGFPREDALLAVLVMTDEEDCTVDDPDTFFPLLESAGNANVFCAENPGLLASVDSLVADLAAVRDPGSMVFAALAGVPVDLVGQDIDTILASPAMQYERAETPVGLAHACVTHFEDGAIRSNAIPARRLLQVAQRIPDALVRSICEESYQPAIAELTRRIGSRLSGVCLGRSLVPAPDGTVDCIVRETLPTGMGCDELGGRIATGVSDDGRNVCDVTQVPGGVGTGWFYDLSDPSCDKVTFTGDAIPPLGATIRFQCLVQLEDSTAPLDL